MLDIDTRSALAPTSESSILESELEYVAWNESEFGSEPAKAHKHSARSALITWIKSGSFSDHEYMLDARVAQVMDVIGLYTIRDSAADEIKEAVWCFGAHSPARVSARALFDTADALSLPRSHRATPKNQLVPTAGPNPVDSIGRMLERLHSRSSLSYAVAIGSRITAMIEDWPSADGAEPPSPLSLRQLIRFLEDRPKWPKPRIYAGGDGLFEAEWSSTKGYHLSLRFSAGGRVRIVVVSPGRLEGQMVTSVQHMHLSDLSSELGRWRVDGWLHGAA